MSDEYKLKKTDLRGLEILGGLIQRLPYLVLSGKVHPLSHPVIAGLTLTLPPSPGLFTPLHFPPKEAILHPDGCYKETNASLNARYSP